MKSAALRCSAERHRKDEISTMKAYKGFNKDLTCTPKGRAFQYKEGETYHEDEAVLCEKGFHACERPLDVFGYYAPGTSVYHEVDLEDVSAERKEDTKVCGKTIKIGAKLDVAGLVKAQFDYIKSHTTMEDTDPKKANAGNYGAANAGNCGAANAGYYGAANAGNCGAANAGNYGAANAGDYGAANAGNYGAANAGNYGAANAGYKGAANAGDYGAANAGYKGAANAGDYGAAISRGEAIVGKYGVAVARGDEKNKNRAKGKIGSILVIALENNENFEIKDFAVGIVDGEKIKANTWYMVKNGQLVEAGDE